MQKALFLVLSLALISNMMCEVTEEEGVLVLTQENFDGVLAENEYVLVEFYAPWCGHCKSLAPEYAKAAATLASQGSAVKLAKVDATEHKDLGSRYGVQGFPTLKWFVSGQPSDYSGGRTEDTIVQWVNKKTQPSSTVFTTQEELDALAAANKVLAVLYGEEGSEAVQTFLDVSKVFEDVTFAHTVTAGLGSGVVLFRSFEPTKLAYEGEMTAAALQAWLTTESVPLVMDFDQASAQRIFGENLPALFLLTSENEASTAALAALNEASTTLKGQIMMSATQVADGLGKRLGEYIGVVPEQCPTLRIVNPTKEGAVLKYEFSGEITAEAIVQFYTNYAAGSLKPAFKSEEVPATQDKFVYVLVGKEFEKVVMDTTKDVMVEFFAPWCGHCKTLAPIYEQLAEKLKTEMPNVVVAAMDATANEAEGVNVEGFPTLKFYPANNKAGLDYKGGRTLEDLEAYIREQATVDVGTTETKTETKEDL